MNAPSIARLNPRSIFHLLGLWIALSCSHVLSAQTTYYWDGNGATTGSGSTTLAGTWGTSAYWGTSATGTSATTAATITNLDTVVFSANDGSGTAANYNGSYTVTLGSAQSVAGLVIAGGNTTTGGTLTLAGTGSPGLTIGAGGVTLNGSNGDPIFSSSIGTITLAASQTWTINNGHVWAVNAAVAGGATTGNTVTWTLGYVGAYTPTYTGIISDGTAGGQLALTVSNSSAGVRHTITGTANTYTGATSITQGTLTFSTLANSGAASSLGAGSIINMGSGTNSTTLNDNGSAAGTGNRTLNLTGTTGNTTLNSNSSGSFGLGSVINAGGGNKTLTLAGNNTTVNASTLGAISNAVDGSTTAVNLTSGVWVLSGNNTFTGGLAVSGNGTLTLTGVANNFDGAIAVSGTTTQLILNGAASFSKGMTITGGTVTIGATGALGQDVTGDNIVVNGGNLNFTADSGFTNTNRSITIMSGGIGIGVGGVLPTYIDSTTNGVVLGLNLVGTAGIAGLTGKSSLGSFTGGTFTGTSLTAGTGNTYRLGGGGGTIVIQNSVLTGANNLLAGNTGGGTVVLANANTYTGNTTIQNGILSVSSINSVGDSSGSSSLGADPLTTANGTINLGSGSNAVGLNYSGAAATTNRVLNMVGSGGTATLSNSGTGAINYSSNATFTAGSMAVVLGNASDTYGGSIGGIVNGSSGTTSLTKQGKTNSVWVLNGTTGATGTNTYTGTTTITGGVLSVTGSAAGGDPLANSFLVLNGNPSDFAILQGSGAINRTISATASAGNVNWLGSGGFAAQGGSLTVTLNGGAGLVWGSGGFLANTNSTLAFGSPTANNQVVFTNNLDLNTGDNYARIIDVEKGAGGDSVLMSGNVTGNEGPSSINKTGGGTLIFGGSTTYAGLTTVNAGALLFNGNSSVATYTSGTVVNTIPGLITVNSGATLGGGGVIGGSIMVNSGAFLAPGSSLGGTGILTFNNNVTLATGSTTIMQINGATTRGTDYSAIAVVFDEGTLTGTGSLVLNFSALLGGGATLDLFTTQTDDRSSFSGVSSAFTSVVLSGAYSGSLTNSAGTWAATVNGQTFSLDDTSGVLSVTGSAIPEPSAYAALIGVLALAGACCLRHRKRAFAAKTV